MTRGILLIVLFAVVIVSGFLAVFQTEYANGWDGYYYLIQVQSLSNTGAMHSPEYSPVYLPIIALHAVTGNYITSFKISVVLIKVLFVLSVFTLSLSLLRSTSGTDRRTAFYTALIAGALSAMSPSLNYFFAQFPKNLLGFAFFFFAISSVYSTSRSWKRRQSSPSSHQAIPNRSLIVRILGVLLLFIATYFTHRFTAVLSLCFLVLYFATAGKRLFLILFVSLLVLLTLSSILSVAFSFYDLEVITSNFSPIPIFVPASFIQNFGAFKLTSAWIAEICLAGALPLITGILLLCRNRFNFLRLGREYYILIMIGLTGLFPFFRFSLTGLSYRLFFATLLILPLICIPYIRMCVRKIINFRHSGSESGREAILVLFFLVLVASSLYTGRSYNPEVHDPPYAFYDELAGEAAQALSGRNCELIIAHKALAEMITFRYEIDALPWSPEEYFQRDRVWRITAGILRDEISYYLSPETADNYYIGLSGDYGLLREDHWEAFLDSIANDPVMLEAVHTWRNPLEQRPAYMRKDR